jgi:hypothetical protein
MNADSDNKVEYNDVRSFARRYLDTYYIEVNEDEPPISKFLSKQGKILKEQNLDALEIGCGPTVHHALSIAPYVKSLDLSEYLPENLEEIKKWKEKRSDAFSWSHYTKMALEQDGMEVTEENIKQREELLRSKIDGLYFCDVTKVPPVDNGKKYPLVLTFYCAEEIFTTHDKWETVIENMSTMISDGGYFIISSLRDTDQFMLGDPEGEYEWLPCCKVTEESLRDGLIKAGFLPESIEIESFNTPGLVNWGIPGILIAKAQKS